MGELPPLHTIKQIISSLEQLNPAFPEVMYIVMWVSAFFIRKLYVTQEFRTFMTTSKDGFPQCLWTSLLMVSAVKNLSVNFTHLLIDTKQRCPSLGYMMTRGSYCSPKKIFSVKVTNS